MKDLKWLGKCVPFGRRNEEEEEEEEAQQCLNNLGDAPIASRLRSRDNKQVEASQTKSNGVTGSKNQTDKQSQHLTHQSNNRSQAIMKSTQVPSSSSSSSRTRKNSSVFPHESNETKSYYERRKKQTSSNKRFSQPTSSEANNNASSSSSRVQRHHKKKNVRVSEQSSQQRPSLQDPDDLPVVEPHTCYIRSQESQRQLVGWRCSFCEKDVGVSPFEEEEEEDSNMYPEVSVLPCGHVFHSSCFQQFQSGDHVDPTDGPCVFCLSLS